MEYNSAYSPQRSVESIPEKPNLGSAKIPFSWLPPSNFTYGCPGRTSNGTAKEALYGWHNSKSYQPKEQHGENYIGLYSKLKLNKIPDIVFGDKSETHEDIKAVLCNAYYHKFIETMKQKEFERREKLREKIERMTKGEQVIIRVSLKEMKDTSPLWKMKKFSNVKAKVSTRRINE